MPAGRLFYAPVSRRATWLVPPEPQADPSFYGTHDCTFAATSTDNENHQCTN